MHKVFISYSHKDADWVKGWLLPKFESNGVPAHVDYRDFEIGVPSLVNMERAVEECAKTLLVLTPNYVESEFTNFEALMLQVSDVINVRKKILPLMLVDCTLPKRLAIFTYADFRDENERPMQLQRLVRQVKKDFAALEPAKPAYPPLDNEHVSLERLPYTGYELFGRQKELQALDEAWAAAGTHVISFVGYGGVGKSTLLNKWLERLRWDNYRGAQKVFAWSFYSQGTNERVTSADKFINDALAWFGDPNPTAGSPWDKGSRLADLIRRHKTLLLLDGMEPLQSAYDFEAGAIKDPALRTLITELGRRNPGLCVITTRVAAPELGRYPQTCQQIDLEKLSAEAGAMLLKVRGTQGSDEALQQATANFGFHALAINLLATYLHEIPGHPIAAAAAIPDLQNIPEQKGRHPRRIMAAFADKLGKVAATELLHLLGMFDRPVELQAIAAVIAKPPIPDLTEPLTSVRDAAFLQACETLRRYKLIAPTSSHNPDTLDCHPLVREHFGEKLRSQNPAAWKEAHARLYEYYKNLPAKELPDTLEEMEPLFAAVAHGCQAGQPTKVWEEVYWKRVLRGNEKYTERKLGAFGADLSALSNFFKMPWDKPSSGISEQRQALVLSLAGFRLRALGRLAEASQPMQAGLNLFVNQKGWINAAANAGNLSELYLTLGKVSQAVASARQSVDFADRSGDWQMQVRNGTSLANSLHQGGDFRAAEKLFHEAEAMQQQMQPQYFYLYSLRGFLFCDLLLSLRQYQDVQKRARQALEWGSRGYTLLDFALDKLSLGRAFLLQALATDHAQDDALSKAKGCLQQAVAGLRKAGTSHHLPRALFARAACYRVQNEFANAQADFEEAREIAERWEMKLFLADYHLEACRLCLAEAGDGRTEDAEEKRRQARVHLEAAAELVEQTGYHRRDAEVEALRAQIAQFK